MPVFQKPRRAPISARAALCWMLAACAALAPAAESISYTTQFSGVDDEAVLESLQSLSDTWNLQSEPPASIAHLRRRAKRDLGRFSKALQAAGYYGATMRAEVRDDATPVQVIFEITPGPLYPFGRVAIVSTEGPDAHLAPPEEVGLQPGAPATAAAILAAEDQILTRLQENGHPLPEIAEREVIADHDSQTVEVRFVVEPGPEAVFGPLDIQGLETVDASVVEAALPWKEGEPFKLSLMEEAEDVLYKRNLFSTAQLSIADSVDESGRIPVRIEVTERKHRTISGGIEYTTDYGAGTELRWEHRNIAGLGNRLSFETHLNALLMDLRGEYHIPRFRREDQALTLDFELAQEDTDAFKSTRVGARGFVERELNERLSVGFGGGFRLSEVEQLDETQQYRLVFLTGRVEWDTTDNELDPTKGLRIRLEVSPYFDVGGGDARFIRSELNISHYLRLDDAADWVLATRARAGSIWAYPPRNVPPDLRFYSGGGGSVRGYPFQSIGPHLGDDPIGGRSVLEAAVELRRRFNKQLGMAVFIDAGMVYAPTFPEFNTKPRIGAGIGLRYFTPLGPLRLDFAVPLNPPDHVDAPFQIYLSIGQAF